jgi:hypothetical protein
MTDQLTKISVNMSQMVSVSYLGSDTQCSTTYKDLCLCPLPSLYFLIIPLPYIPSLF